MNKKECIETLDHYLKLLVRIESGEFIFENSGKKQIELESSSDIEKLICDVKNGLYDEFLEGN